MDYIVIIVLGLVCGSFLNVLIERLKQGKGFVTGRSRCDYCQKVLQWYELIPIISFCVQFGKCRTCKRAIARQHLYMEIVTASAFVLVYYAIATNVVAPPTFWLQNVLSYPVLVLVSWLTFTGILIIIFVYDLRHYLILDVITIPAMVVTVILQLALDPTVATAVTMLWGAVIGGGFFLLQYMLSKGTWIGGGDIRLGIVMGLMLGWQHVLVALLLAYVVGAVVGLVLIVTKHKDPKSHVPFGTFLSAATFVTLLYGEQLLSWYLSSFF